MAKASTSGLMAPSTLASGRSIKLAASAPTSGLTVEFTKASGVTTTCMAEVSIRGATEGNTQVTIKTTRSMDRAPTCGQTAVPTPAAGRMESSTGKESTNRVTEALAREFGLRENAAIGPMNTKGLLSEIHTATKIQID